MLGNDAVGKFVEEDGREEEKAGQDAHGPMLCVGPKWMLLLELRGNDVGDGQKNENPSGVEIDGNSENFADAQAWQTQDLQDTENERVCKRLKTNNGI